MNPVENSVQPLTLPPPRPSGPSPRSVRAFCGLTSLLAALAGFAWFSGTANPAHAQPLGRAGKLSGRPVVRALTPDPAPVTLPIEVMGADGTVVAVSVQVPPTPTPVAALWMQVHGLSYEDKASVQVNYGRWIPLNNQTAAVEEPGKSYGGIGGGFSTLKLNLPLRWPLARISKGFNRISFRFNHTDGVSTGFRVLKLQMLTAQGRPVLTPDSFVEEDPGQWQPPLADDASLAAGATLWHTAQLNESSLVGAPAILATCSDCHTQDGRDLKYFSYSNHSIVERSKFHGLTEQQGQQIASYIRTLKNADGSNVPSPGRPWNPPYQPGPGLESKPAAYWAAGAGVDAALAKDSDTLPYLFPNGITDPATAKAAISTEGNLNVRELPVALQLLDWNRWLPRIHPKDAYGAAFLRNAAFTDYTALRAALSGPNADAYKTQNVGSDQPSPNMTAARLDLNHWFTHYETFVDPKVAPADTPWTPLYSQQVYSSALWQRVKVWELMQEFGMENLGRVAFGPRADERTWLDPGTFMISPGKSHLPATINQGGFTDNILQFETLNNQWYYLGLVLNAGNGYRAGTNPIDYGYARARILNLMQAGGPAMPLMELVWITKGSQQGAGLGVSDTLGWAPISTGDLTDLFYEDPWYTTRVGQQDKNAGWAPGTENSVVQAALQTWFNKVQTYTPTQFYAAGVADPSEVPAVRDNGRFCDRVAAYIYYARKMGLDQVLLGSVCDWAKTVWPQGDWISWKLSTRTTGTVLASASAPGPSGTGSNTGLSTAPSRPYYVEFDVTEMSYVDRNFALVTVLDPSGNGRGYQFGLGTLYNANDLHVLLNRISDAGTTSGQQEAKQFDAKANVGKTVHVRAEINGQHFLLRASDPMPAPQMPFTGNYPYETELRDSTYPTAGAKIGVKYTGPLGVTAVTGLHVSNWQVVQPQM